jgi:hypothetical protein
MTKEVGAWMNTYPVDDEGGDTTGGAGGRGGRRRNTWHGRSTWSKRAPKQRAPNARRPCVLRGGRHTCVLRGWRLLAR